MVVQANPKILIKGNIPSIYIMEDPLTQARRPQLKRSSVQAEASPTEGMANLSRSELHMMATKYEMLQRQIHVPRSQSVMNDKKELNMKDALKRKRLNQSLLDAQVNLKDQKLTQDDIMRYYCDFDQE